MTSSTRTVSALSLRVSALALAGLATVAIGAGLAWSPGRTWPNLLANVYLLSIALSGALFISIHYLSGAGRSVVLRRIAEAMTSALPFAALLMLSTFFGRRTLYPWAQPAESIGVETPAANAVYLSTPFVFARMALVLGVWVLLARALRTASLRQDADVGITWHRRLVARSAVFVVYARRTDPSWMRLFLLNLGANWLLPFLVLLPRAAKRRGDVLAAVCGVLLAGHWLDLYLVIMPAVWIHPEAGLLEAIVPLGYARLFFYLTSRALSRAPLLPVNDPFLSESLSHET